MNNYHFIQETYTRYSNNNNNNNNECISISIIVIIMLFRNQKMLDLLVIALPDIEDNYNTLIGNQRRGYQRG